MAQEGPSRADNLNLRSYRDDATSVSFEEAENTAIIEPSEASDEEFFRDGERRFVNYLQSTRLKKISSAVYKWIKGPDPPRPWKIRPFYPEVQIAPVKLLRKYFPEERHRFWVLVAYYVIWVAAFAVVLHKSAFTADVPGHGSPVRINCFDRFW
jgi:hypothetical protein